MSNLLFSLEALLGLIALFLIYNRLRSKPKNLTKSLVQMPPEPAGRWPIIGHLHLLVGNQLLMRTLGSLTDKNGPIFAVWVGARRTVVISSWELAKECFTTNDKALASRPESLAGKYLGYDHTNFSLSPYNSYWRNIRKIATVELLSARRLDSLRHVWAGEIQSSITGLYDEWVKNQEGGRVKVDMKQWFENLSFNNIVRMIAGKRYFGANVCSGDPEEARRFREVILKVLYLSGVFVVSDAIPSLRWLDVGGHTGVMRKTGKEMDAVVSLWVEEHRRRRNSGEKGEDRDFIEVLMSSLEKSPMPDYDTDTIIKAAATTLIIGGTDTTSITLTWALSLLMNNPHALKAAEEELDAIVGQNRRVEESDIKKLPYLQAIVKETLRLYPSAPLGIPHKAIEDCNIGGFHVPAGTHLMVNIWKMQRDASKWWKPDRFQPERFLSSDVDRVDVRGQHFELIPFGSGRRMCPGMSFALQSMHLTLARLLHGFNLRRTSSATIDMTEDLGITLPKSTPLEVLLTPRLPPHLYH